MRQIVFSFIFMTLFASASFAESLASLRCQNMNVTKAFQTQKLQWFEPKDQPMKAVALVVHGLNNNSEIMLPLIQVLNAQGIGALNVKLTGYEKNKEDLRNITADQWIKDVFEANCALQSKAKDLPQIYVGYSLGALIGEILMSANLREKFEFQKALLFSPSIRIHDTSYWINLFSFLGSRASMISFAPSRYVAYRTTPNAAYKALFGLISIYSENLKTNSRAVNIPTLAFVDPNDELVSSDYLDEMIGAANLDQWNLIKIKKDSSAKTWFHHVTIDEYAVGQKTWQQMLKQITEFLN